MSNDRYQKIRDALMMGPTSGPWDGIKSEGSGWIDIYQTGDRYATPIAYVPPLSVLDENGSWKESKGETMANARYIAACDPDTIWALLAERDQLAAALEAAREDAERYRCLRAQNVIAVTSHDQSVEYQRDDLDAAIDRVRGKETRRGQ